MRPKPSSAEPLLGLLAYQLLLLMLLPLAVLLLPFVWILSPRLRRFFPHRLGLVPGLRRLEGTVLVHAASVGELNGLEPFLRILERRQEPFSLSLATDTGLLRARQRHPQVLSFILPFDSVLFLAPLFRHPPRKVIITETELWPGLILLCRLRRIPLHLVNGRISPSNLRRLILVRPFVRILLDSFDSLFVQDRFTLEAVRRLCPGARPVLAGHTKTEGAVPPRSPVSRKAYGIPPGPVLLGASLREDEHLLLTRAWLRLRGRFRSLRLVLVPRHLDVVGRWEADLRRLGLAPRRLSLTDRPDADPSLLVADRMGVLNDLYTLSDIVLVGGTLADIGGHNPIEPAARGNAVLHGPHTYNNLPAFELLQDHGASILVHDTEEIVRTVTALLSSPRRLEAMKRKALRAVRSAPPTSRILYESLFGRDRR